MTQEQLEEFARARLGRTLNDKWTLDTLLGVGGTASVYAARHKNGKRVALKVLHPELSMHEHFRERFLREAYVGNRIEHPGAITVYDNEVTDDGCAFLVMDLLEGENLEVRRERKGGVLDALEVLSLMDAVLDTLHAAHEKGVVHRDIKPENLFLTHDNQLRLLDFGIAHINVPQNPGQTLAGVSMGTPAFMPPEQASAHWDKVDAQSDLWAVGASMFTLLTGRYVHQGGTVNESLVLAVTKPAPRVESINPGLPRPVAAIVNRALERDKNKRYKSAAEMQQDIRMTFHVLQQASDAGELDRYSISDGLVGKHSMPPRLVDLPFTLGAVKTDPPPPEAADEEMDRKSFRPGPDRRWVLAGAAALLVVLGLLVLTSGDGDPVPRAPAAENSASHRPPAASDSAWADMRKSLETPPAKAEPSAEPPTVGSIESLPEDDLPQGSRSRRRRPNQALPPSQNEPAGGHAPGHSPPKPEDFDPLAERQ